MMIIVGCDIKHFFGE